MRPTEVTSRSRFRIAVAMAAMAACGGAPREPSHPAPASPSADASGETGHLSDPDLNRPPPPKLLAIDWSSTPLGSDADALALWERIAPTGEDWSDKLEEIPADGDIAAKLALALLRSGNFTCVQPQHAVCGKPPIEVPEPGPDATLADPCLRRLLALWSINQLGDAQLAEARDALRAIAAIPPPESELVAAALGALPETDHVGRLELYAIAFRAGHRELVNSNVGTLDDAHLLEAVLKHHIDGALDLITAESNEDVFLAAVTDEQLHPQARVQAISELVDAAADDKLGKAAVTAITRATRSPNCRVAAAAAQFLVRSGERKFAPARPRITKPASLMRGLCVLASYELGLRADEPSFLLGYVPKKGLEVATTTYDEYNDVDTDGDGNPHTETKAVIVPRDEVMLPEVEDLVRAFEHCNGTTCRSDDREFRFVFKGGLLTRLEIIELPPCKATSKAAIPNP